MEFFTTLTTITLFGYFWVWLLATVFVIGGFFLAEYNENGYPNLFYIIAYVGLFYFWGIEDKSWFGEIFTWQYILSYVGIGLVYAGIRTVFNGREYKNKIELLDTNSYTADALERNRRNYERIGISNLKGNVIRWWLAWPISLIYWIISDAFRAIWDWVYGLIENVFIKLFKLGFNGK